MKSNRLWVLLLLCGALVTGSAFAAGPAPGLRTMEHPELLPLLFPNGVQTRQSSSYDPSGANDDGNFRTAYTKYIDENGEYVIFDASGPGCLYRQQYNVWSRGRSKQAGQGRIKYYFDNEPKPRVDLSVDDFFAGKHAPFTAPFAFFDAAWRFGIVYYPFPFKTRLKVTTTLDLDQVENPNSRTWYQYTYLTYPDSSQVTTWRGPEEDSRMVRNQWDNLGSDPKAAEGNLSVSNTVAIPNGATKEVAVLKGEGSIASLKIRVDPYSRELFYRTILLIYWDNSKVPAVEIPLGLFFGGGGEKYDTCQGVPDKVLRTLFYGFDGPEHQFYSYWPMPYWRAARIELRNESGIDLTSVKCDLQYKPATVLRYPRESTGHFHAKRTISRDAGRDVFATSFDETGRGHVVGLSFYSSRFAMDGDEFTYIDGSRTPQIHGDGTEDDHNQGWGGAAYQKPLWGGLVNGYQGAYRVYMNDAYIFNRHIRINYEFSREGGTDFGGETDSVVYYYKAPSSGNLVLTDEVDVGDAASEQAHSYKIKEQTWSAARVSGYDGYERKYDYDVTRDDGRAHHGYSEFTIALAPDNDGIKLRRRIYRSGNGIQRADVYVDGTRVGQRPWDICTQSSAPAYQGWFDADFEIPRSYTDGKRSVRIRVQYVKGDKKPEINEFFYWVYSYVKRSASQKVIRVEALNAVPSGSYKIDLSWKSDQPLPLAQYYRVYRSRNQQFSEPALVGTSNALRFSDTAVRPNAQYHYRVAAVDPDGLEGPASALVAAGTGPEIKDVTAAFLDKDDATKGNWGGKYGSDGFAMLQYFYGRDAQALPDYVSGIDYSGLKGRQFSILTNSTGSSLVTSPISWQRSLGALETNASDSVVVYVNDAQPHELAIYVCDFDKAGREEDIELLDLNDRVISAARKLAAFEQGIWLRYRFSGSVKVRLTNRNRATSAVISALMFDPAKF